MRCKKTVLATAALLGSLHAINAMAGCAGLVVGTYSTSASYTHSTYLCISNQYYDTQTQSGFSNGSCPANSFPVQVSSYTNMPSRCCFAAGTPVWLADGRKLPIEQLVPGDEILAYNLDTGKLEATQILNTHVKSRPVYQMSLNNGAEQLRLTDDHPLWDGEQWLAIDPEKAALAYAEYQLALAPLVVGARLVCSAGDRASVSRVTPVHPALALSVYTLFVDHPGHNYIVGELGVVAHNKNRCGG